MEQEMSIKDLIQRVRRLDAIVKYGFLGSKGGKEHRRRKYLLDKLGRGVIDGDRDGDGTDSSDDGEGNVDFVQA